MKQSSLSHLFGFTIFLALLIIAINESSAKGNGHFTIRFQPSSPESPVSIPSEGVEIPIVDLPNMTTRVIGYGNLSATRLAVHPQTQELFFTEYNYRDQFFPRRLFRLSPNARQVYIPKLTEIGTVPVVNQYTFYSGYFEVDENGNLYLAKDSYLLPQEITALAKVHLLKLDGDKVSTIELPDVQKIRSFKLLHQDLPNYDINQGDFLLFVSQSTGDVFLVLDRDTQEVKVLNYFAPQDEEIIDYALGPEESIYLLDFNLQIKKLLPSGDLEIVTDLSTNLNKEDLYSVQFDYLKDEQAFYISNNNGPVYLDNTSQLYRISIKDFIPVQILKEDDHVIEIKSSPHGNVLYTVAKHSLNFGSIQAHYPEFETPTAVPVASLEMNDFNTDGASNQEDVKTIFNHFMAKTIPTNTEMIFMDLHRDGKITPQDAQDLWIRLQ